MHTTDWRLEVGIVNIIPALHSSMGILSECKLGLEIPTWE